MSSDTSLRKSSSSKSQLVKKLGTPDISNILPVSLYIKHIQNFVFQQTTSPSGRCGDVPEVQRAPSHVVNFSGTLNTWFSEVVKVAKSKYGARRAQALAEQGKYCTLVVRKGNCLSEIARIANTPLDVIRKINNIENAECLKIGQVLLIPRSQKEEVLQAEPERLKPWQRPKTRERWVLVNLGDSLWSLADAYGVTIEALRAANGLPQGSNHLDVGQEVRIPQPPPRAIQFRDVVDAVKTFEASSAILPLQFALRPEAIRNIPILGDPRFSQLLPVWKPEKFGLPVQGGWLSSYYGWKDGRWYFHNGIDIAVEEGTPVLAATSGQVTYAGWRGGYGKTVCLDHGDGHATLYAHNSEVLVRRGQLVRKGHTIALSGNTGYSTGPHLHFEVHRNGLTIDPLGVIPTIL